MCCTSNCSRFDYTPKHGSWLDIAEIELSVLAQQCLDRRIAIREQLAHEVAAWEEEHNAAAVTIAWRFTTDDARMDDARIKLKHLYPTLVRLAPGTKEQSGDTVNIAC